MINFYTTKRKKKKRNKTTALISIIIVNQIIAYNCGCDCVSILALSSPTKLSTEHPININTAIPNIKMFNVK